MPIQQISMQQPPSAIEGLLAGSQVGGNIMDTFNRARAAALGSAIAKQQLLHQTVMNPLQEALTRTQSQFAPQQEQTNLDISKAHLNKLGIDAHAAALLAPMHAKLLDAQAKNLNAFSDQHEAQATRYDAMAKALTSGGDAKSGKPDLISQIVNSLDPNDPASLELGTRYAMMQMRSKLNPGGLTYITNPQALIDDTNTMKGIIGSHLAQRQQMTQQAAAAQQYGGQMAQGLIHLFSQAKGAQQAPAAADPSQVYNKMRDTAGQMGGSIPELPASPQPQQMAAPAAPPYDPTSGALKAMPGAGAPMTPPAAPPMASPAAASAVPTVMTTADYEALPVGSPYVVPGKGQFRKNK